MIRRIDRLDVFSFGFLGGAAVLTAALYRDLPARMPTHFDAHGVANGWMDRRYGAFALLFAGLLAWFVTRFARTILPRSWSTRLGGTPLVLIAFVFAAFLSAAHVVNLYAATHPGAAMARAIVGVVGAMWIALGQLMPRIRRNPILGIRTPWTLTSDENWLRTHRFAAYTFAIGGLVAVVVALLGGAAGSPLAVAALVAGGVAPVVYSYVLARRLDA